MQRIHFYLAFPKILNNGSQLNTITNAIFLMHHRFHMLMLYFIFL